MIVSWKRGEDPEFMVMFPFVEKTLDKSLE